MGFILYWGDKPPLIGSNRWEAERNGLELPDTGTGHLERCLLRSTITDLRRNNPALIDCDGHKKTACKAAFWPVVSGVPIPPAVFFGIGESLTVFVNKVNITRPGSQSTS